MNPSYTVPAMTTLPVGHSHSGPQALHARQYLTDLSTSLFSFVLPLLPTAEELATKEEVRVLIERLIKTIEPSSRLLSFGSSCNSFGLRNSDMDLVCLIDNKEAALHASDLVAMIGDLLERETNFEVKPLPKARIPIIKLTLQPSPGLPYGIACDIGFENRLALENTRLLLTYATIDPARIRTLVLFLKVWSKRRKINSPYKGTLSSYGFTLMVIFYLVHVKNPPVLPNLQRIAPLRPMTKEEMTLEGRDVWFFDDTETLRKEWSSANFESVGELLIDFFRYFSHEFQYNNTVISIRAGHLTKESKGWMNDIDVGGINENARDRNRLCIEDPFETPYNVARTVTKDGLYTIRGEFMRATRILTARPDRAVLALAELCVEREEELARAPRSASPAPRSMSGRGGFRGGWRGDHGGHPQFDRYGPHLNGMTIPDEGEFGRRSYSHGGNRRGRRSEGNDGPHFGQDTWPSSQNFGGPDMGGPSSAGYNGHFGHHDSARGRDTAPRGQDDEQYHYDDAQSQAGGTYSENGEMMGTGQPMVSASAPISPAKSSNSLSNEPKNYNGTWSAGASPRQGQHNLPRIHDHRGGGHFGGRGRRPSHGKRPRNALYDSFPSASLAAGSNRRSYSAGPPQYDQGGFQPHPFPTEQAGQSLIDNIGPGGAFPNVFPPPPVGSAASGLPDPLNGAFGPASFMNNSELAYTDQNNPLSNLPSMQAFPAMYQSSNLMHVPPVRSEHASDSGSNVEVGDKDREDLRALDELTSRVGHVALGLDDEYEGGISDEPSPSPGARAVGGNGKNGPGTGSQQAA